MSGYADIRAEADASRAESFIDCRINSDIFPYTERPCPIDFRGHADRRDSIF